MARKPKPTPQPQPIEAETTPVVENNSPEWETFLETAEQTRVKLKEVAPEGVTYVHNILSPCLETIDVCLNNLPITLAWLRGEMAKIEKRALEIEDLCTRARNSNREDHAVEASFKIVEFNKKLSTAAVRLEEANEI